MFGTIAPTDYEWYDFLLQRSPLEEVNFWRPSAFRPFRAEQFSPFLFKLKAPHNSICGFGFFARYSAIPYWLAWETFGVGNGCATQDTMSDRIAAIRKRMNFRGNVPADHIGCILLVTPIFFQRDQWIPQPTDWPPRNLTPMRYDLEAGEGRRVWEQCLQRASAKAVSTGPSRVVEARDPLYGKPQTIRPRLGQGSFRISVTEAYGRACAVTGEHSLPVLDAAHIRPYSKSGPHEICNGLLLRSDLHRLFDKGYITVTPDQHVEVSPRLKQDYENGRSYYPFHGQKIRPPTSIADAPLQEFLQWHSENCYRA